MFFSFIKTICFNNYKTAKYPLLILMNQKNKPLLIHYRECISYDFIAINLNFMSEWGLLYSNN